MQFSREEIVAAAYEANPEAAREVIPIGTPVLVYLRDRGPDDAYATIFENEDVFHSYASGDGPGTYEVDLEGEVEPSRIRVEEHRVSPL